MSDAPPESTINRGHEPGPLSVTARSSITAFPWQPHGANTIKGEPARAIPARFGGVEPAISRGMNAPRLRAIPAAEPCLRVAPGATLQASAGKEPSILVLGNGQSVPLNPLASAALSLCDGTRNAGEIAASVPQGAARENVMEFLAAAVSLGWIMSDTSIR